MPDCIKCGEAIYIGSRLPEDSYIQTDQGYEHTTCPIEPGFRPGYATVGRCNMCGYEIDPTYTNSTTYCSRKCAIEMEELRNPPREDDDFYDDYHDPEDDDY